MFERVTPDKAMAFVRVSITMICGWPLPSVATKTQVLCYRILKVFSALSALALFFPVLNAAILYVDDFPAFSKAVVMVVAAVQVFYFTLLCTIKHDDFQRLIEEIKASLKNVKSYERNVYQRYVDTYYKFYGLTVMWYYASPMVIVVGSIFLPQPFPTISEYPFDVEYKPVRIVIFVHQAIAGFQCSAAVSLNMFAALLLLYTAAKYEILMIDMRRATSVDALIACVKKYDAVNRLVRPQLSWIRVARLKLCDVTNQMLAEKAGHFFLIWRLCPGCRFLRQLFDIVVNIIATIIITLLLQVSFTNIILCGFNIIGRQPFIVKLQFVVLCWTGLTEVFMCALPADRLINVSANAVRSVYESTWYDQVLDVQKTVLRILVPQEPMAISIKCFIPVVCLEYYCSYISNTVSLFTALRVVLLDEDEDLPSSKSTNSTRSIG
ncbi:uncharacterized protein LOC143210807 [Lasioglossum baleicum]|uniref:uncharacterized protein LOC143210807 n=1 Tax=Lasioglossum baleicum TaxID=434251 RepID=UPI003FCC5044